MTDAAPAQAPAQAALPPAAPAQESAPMGAEHNNTVTAKPPNVDTRLRESIKDAYTLLDFASRRALEVAPDVRAPIIASHQSLARGQTLSADEEACFWQAFADIIEEVQPVTVESIVFTSPPTVPPSEGLARLKAMLFPPKSDADKVLRRYHSIALITLFLLLALQVEWAIGMSIYNDAYQVHKNLMSSTESFLNAQQQLTLLEQKSDAAQTDAQLETATLKRAQARDQSWEDVSYLRLWWWNRGVASTIPPFDLRLSDPNDADIPGTSDKLNGEGKRRIEFTRADLTLEVISKYYLVALFAMLGAMTQALRRLSREIADVALTRSSLYSIRTRIILGIISGVCMAWLTIIYISQPTAAAPGNASGVPQNIPLDAISFLGAFTPWAMAFVSGYSVEIFFTALERLIEYITNRIQTLVPSGKSPPPAAEEPQTPKAKAKSATSDQPPQHPPPAQPQQT